MSEWQSRSANLTQSKLARDLHRWTPRCGGSCCADNESLFQIQPKIFVLWCGSRLQKKKRADLCSNTKPALNHQPSRERLTIMSTHVSATALEETPHETETTQITITDALRHRALAVINDRRTDPRWRSIIRYALEINDPWLSDIVRRAGAGEKIIDSVDFSLEPTIQ